MQLLFHSSTSNILRFPLLDSSSITGDGLTGLDHTSSGLVISTFASAEATATSYTVAGSNLETISTLGTYAAPTASKARFKAIDATNFPGWYELQLADARFAIASATYLDISIYGATNLVPARYRVQLPSVNMYVTGGNVAANFVQYKGATAATADSSGYPVVTIKDGTGQGELQTAGGRTHADVVYWNGAQVATVTQSGVPEVDITHVGGSAVSTAALADAYWAEVHYLRDSTNAADEYTVVWYKNATPQTSGITTPTIGVVNYAGTTVIAAATGMSAIGSTGAQKYTATGAARQAAGDSVIVTVTATIDAATRTWIKVLGRDV